ncbi:MAG: hypothetical protein V1824_04420 [archaeon]
MKKKLLLNFVYYNPVGHVVEGLKYARGFYEANKDLEISIALNKYAPYNLANLCSWIKNIYPIDVYEILDKGNNASCLKQIPLKWDYIVTNNLPLLEARFSDIGQEETGFLAYLNYCIHNFKSKSDEGKLYALKKGKYNDSIESKSFIDRLPKELKYKIDSKIIFKLPKENLEFIKKYDYNGKKICIMLGGSGEACRYPSVDSWIKIIDSLNKKFKDLRIYITGIRKKIKGRTNTSAYSDKEINKIINSSENIIDCYDIGFLNQLALVESCDIFLSPHTGFGFLASCVATPGLTLSGGNWGEFFYNGTPFYSIFPNDPNYPHSGALDTENRIEKIPGMNNTEIEKKNPEIITAVKLLLDKNFTYKKALAKHKENIAKANIRKDIIVQKPFF